MESKKLTDQELIEEAEKLDFSDLLPFEMVQGDTIRRLRPGSSVNLNSSAAWLVSQEARAAHRLRTKPAEIEQALALIPELASRLKSANGRLDAANDVKAAQKIVLEHLEKELKSANELLDERLKQVAVLEMKLKSANEKLEDMGMELSNIAYEAGARKE